MTAPQTPAATPLRTTSLRTRWHRAFAVLTFVLLLSGVTAMMGTRLVVNTFRESAVDVERDATINGAIRDDLIAYTIAYASLPNSPRVAPLEAELRAGFAGALATEAPDQGLLEAARAEFESMVAIGVAAPGFAGMPIRATAATDRAPLVMSLLDQAGVVNRAAVREDLTAAANLEREAMVGIGLFGLVALVLVLRMARKLSTQVLVPVGKLRDSANYLAAGELDHRVVVDRVDELGELAVSFNTMAEAIAGSQRSLTREANHDSLTGLANRASFHASVTAALARPERRSGGHAVLFVDLDDFKDVNDTLGHAAGDELLCEVGRRLSDAIRPGDLVARLGGDEFALLLDAIPDVDVAFAAAERMVAILAEPVNIGEHVAHVGASIGLAMREADSTIDSLMREADVAMYAAKGKGKNRVERYDAGLDDMATDRLSLRADLAGAAGRGELRLAYQPVVELETGVVLGLEALVRWEHPARGLLQPLAFIGLAEETGAIVDIGNWVLRTAAAQLRTWQLDHGLADLALSVNVSMCQLEAPGFAEDVAEVLRDTGVAPDRLVIEVTESVLADPARNAAATLAAVRVPGVRVALDDFGTGYSSIAYLSDLPVDMIKIDRSFVADASSASSAALLGAIVAMARSLDLGVIAEGIEEIDQLHRLVAMDCHVGQGYLMARPLAPEAVGLLLALPEPFLALGLSPTAATPS